MTRDTPIFADVFANSWATMPPILQARYANRPYSSDVVTVQGVLQVKRSLWMRLLGPFLSLSGALINQDGQDIPVTVCFRSEPNSSRYWFDRTFYFNKPLRFTSCMEVIKSNTVVEFMGFGLGWRTQFSYDGKQVNLAHAGYVLRVFNFLIPIPLELIIGKCDAYETPLSDTSFSMSMSLQHFLFGKTYEYYGVFTRVEKS